MIGLWHDAARRLRGQRRSAAVIGTAGYIAAFLCVLSGCMIQGLLNADILSVNKYASGSPNLWDVFLISGMLTAVLALTPLRMQSAWAIGSMTGTLDRNDLGFLACSGSVWLWGRAIAVRLLSGTVLLLSAVPSLLLYVAAKSIWLLIPPDSDSTLALLTVLHLGIPAAAGIWLPLRVLAAETALPFAYLKEPHASAFHVLRNAFRMSRAQTAGILLMRLLTLPFLLIPFTAVWFMPVLLTAEQIRCVRAQRHMQPKGSSLLSHLELHAYEPDAEAF